jgi:Ca2+-binding RTX toxin-like protein
MSKGKHGKGHHFDHHGKGKVILLGTDEANVLAADAASMDFRHKIAGFGGDDTLTGGNSRDHIWGGDGNDIINGGDGRDHLWGGAGNDMIDGGLGNDKAWGGSGDDAVNGGDGNDHLEGGSGIDTVHGNMGNDSLRGGKDNDFLFGDEGNDILRGGSGNDELTGGAGSDLFKFGSISDSDTVMDFTVHGDPAMPNPDADLIDLRSFGLMDFAALQAMMMEVTNPGPDPLDPTVGETKDTTITLLGDVASVDDDVVITLKGIAMADLTAADFLI